MIKANELRVGNCINYGYKVAIVNAIREDGGINVKMENTLLGAEFECFEPIPLTPSILEKAGFLKEDWSYIFPFNGGNTAYSIEQYGSKFGFCYSGQVTKETWIEYLHQLQNLYFCLTGEELEIKSPE